MKEEKEIFGLSGQEEILANLEAEADEVEETLPEDDEDPYQDYRREEMEAMKRNQE